MANALYPLFRKALLTGTSLDLSNAGTDVRCILVDTNDYTYNAAHEFLEDVAAGSRVAVSSALASKTVSDAAVFDAADKTLSAVTGDPSEALIFYVHTGDESTARLIAYIDTGVTGLPVTPNGGDISLAWHANGIFGL